MTKKKHYIKDISDIKYCEENGIELYDEYQATVCFRFVDGVWCSYTNKNLNAYNVKLSLNSLYYEEEPEEPMQEATEEDENTLCVFWRGDSNKYYGVLDYIQGSGDFKMLGGSSFPHCRRLSPAEVAEITGYKVEEK